MIVKQLTEHHLEFLSLNGGCRGLSESTLVKMSNCWKSHAAAQIESLSVMHLRVVLPDVPDDSNIIIKRRTDSAYG